MLSQLQAREDTLKAWEAALDERLAELEAAGAVLDTKEEAAKEREKANAIEAKRLGRQGLEWSFSYWKVVSGLTLRDAAVHQRIAKEVTNALAMRRAGTVTRYLSRQRRALARTAWDRLTESVALHRRHRQLLRAAAWKMDRRQLGLCYQRWVGVGRAGAK